jgi:integrase
MAGHIERRGENSFRLIVSNGTAADGNRIVHKKTIKVSPIITEAKKIKEAEKAMAAFVTEIEKGEYKKPTTLSFDDLFEKWIASHQGDKRLAPKTEARYREMYNLRIKNYFNKYKPENIDADVLDEFFINLRKSKRKDGKEGFLSEQSVKHHYRLLSAVFSYAYRKRLIKSNPMVFTEPVDAKQKQTDCFDETQVSILIDAVEQAELKFKVITHLAIASGCRLGELVGLMWDDINLEKRTINIVRTAQYISDFNKAEFLEKYPSYFEDLLNQNIVKIIESSENTIKLLDGLLDRKIIIKSPKTEKSSRIITLPDTVIHLLSQYQREQKIKQIKAANKWNRGFSWVFTDDFGDVMHPYTPSKWFHKFIKNYNKGIIESEEIKKEQKAELLLKEISFHGLRHTSASLLISKGQDVVTVSKRLGHSNSGTTLKIYAHAFEKLDQEAADSLNSIFKEKESKKTNIIAN